MSEEEKEAVEMLNSYINAIDTFGTIDTKCCNNLYKPTKTVLDYIDKLQKENEHLKDIKNKAIEYIEENSFEDTTGVTLNLSDENYWKVLKLLKGEDIE